MRSQSSTCCGFTPDGVFKPNNWNCPTINRIRNLVYEGHGWEHPELEDGVPEINYQYCDDNKYATINVSDIWDEGREGSFFPLHDCLWVGWYKNRGATQDMWLVGRYAGEPGCESFRDECLPRRPTRDELIKIADYFEKRYPAFVDALA